MVVAPGTVVDVADGGRAGPHGEHQAHLFEPTEAVRVRGGGVRGRPVTVDALEVIGVLGRLRGGSSGSGPSSAARRPRAPSLRGRCRR